MRLLVQEDPNTVGCTQTNIRQKPDRFWPFHSSFTREKYHDDPFFNPQSEDIAFDDRSIAEKRIPILSPFNETEQLRNLGSLPEQPVDK